MMFLKGHDHSKGQRKSGHHRLGDRMEEEMGSTMGGDGKALAEHCHQDARHCGCGLAEEESGTQVVRATPMVRQATLEAGRACELRANELAPSTVFWVIELFPWGPTIGLTPLCVRT